MKSKTWRKLLGGGGWLVAAAMLVGGLRAADVAAETAALEAKIGEAVKSSRVTVVHFWAPWCANCAAELAKNGWSTFIDTNAETDFIFVTTWASNMGDGRELLTKNDVGTQKNFQLFLHPKTSLKTEDKMTTFLGQPVSWLPSTWIYKDGKLRYALNYGELRFPMLQQLIRDAEDKWER